MKNKLLSFIWRTNQAIVACQVFFLYVSFFNLLKVSQLVLINRVSVVMTVAVDLPYSRELLSGLSLSMAVIGILFTISSRLKRNNFYLLGAFSAGVLLQLFNSYFLWLGGALIILLATLLEIRIIDWNFPRFLLNVVLFLISFMLFIEIFSALNWFLVGVFGLNETPFVYVANLATSIHYSYFYPTIVIILMLVFSWFGSIVTSALSKDKFHLIKPILSFKILNFKVKSIRLYFLPTIIVSVFLALYVYLPFVNPYFFIVSVDIPYYEKWLQSLEKTNPLTFLNLIFSRVPNIPNQIGDRPLVLLLLSFYNFLNVNPKIFLAYMPAILAPSLVTSVFLTFRKVWSDKEAFIAAVATAFSPFIMSNIYAGFYANWVAMIFLYPLLFCLSKLMLGFRKSFFLASLFFASLIWLSHAYTWLQMLLILAAYIFITALFQSFKCLEADGFKANFYCLFLFLAVMVAFDFARFFATGSCALANTLGKTSPLYEFKSSLSVGFFFLVLAFFTGGGLYNPLMWFLGLFGFFSLDLRNSFERILIIWLALSGISFLLAEPWLVFRVLLNLPLPLFVAKGLNFLMERLKVYGKWFDKLIFIFFVTFCLSHSLHYLYNIVSK